MMRLLDKMNFNHLKVATVSQSAGAVLGRGQWGEEVLKEVFTMSKKKRRRRQRWRER